MEQLKLRSCSSSLRSSVTRQRFQILGSLLKKRLCPAPLRWFSGIMGTWSRDQVSMESDFSAEWCRAGYLRYSCWGKRVPEILSHHYGHRTVPRLLHILLNPQNKGSSQKIIFSYNEADIILYCFIRIISLEANTMLERETSPHLWGRDLGPKVQWLRWPN